MGYVITGGGGEGSEVEYASEGKQLLMESAVLMACLLGDFQVAKCIRTCCVFPHFKKANASWLLCLNNLGQLKIYHNMCLWKEKFRTFQSKIFILQPLLQEGAFAFLVCLNKHALLSEEYVEGTTLLASFLLENSS